MTEIGFSHSEISGSKPVSGSPKLIAAYYVLHRLLMPRHPPYALHNLTIYLLLGQLAYSSFSSRCFLPKLSSVKEHPRRSAWREFSYFENSELRKATILFSNLNSQSNRKMVEDSGIEPLTSCVQGRRSPS